MALKYLLGIHLLGALIWVGGMFFLWMVLRPSMPALDPPVRLKLHQEVFRRFFPWVWVSAAALLVTGYWMVLSYFGGMKGSGMYIHLMMGIGTLMAMLFAWQQLSPYRLFKAAMAAGDVEGAGRQIARIRHIIAVNLVMGLVVALLASTGKYLFA